MSNDLPQDIRRIIAAQSEVNLPRSITLPVLPKIGHVAGSKSSTKDESERMKQNTSNSLEPTPAQKLPRLLGADKMHLVEPRRIAPILHPRSRGDDFKFNYSFIPNRETLQHPYSTTRESVDSPLTPNNFLGPSRFDKTFVIREETPLPSSDSISLLDLKLASIPHSLPDMLGLQNAVDNLSNRRVANILDACRLYDRELRGYLCVPSLIKCFGEIIPSVHSPSSPWRLFLQSLAPDGEFVEYEKLIQLVQRHRHDVNIEETMQFRSLGFHSWGGIIAAEGEQWAGESPKDPSSGCCSFFSLMPPDRITEDDTPSSPKD
ncbi:hypothetical protein NECAME_12757 [Necator americanus]|uniref:Uncharacterized protein n=1 Tax=Necator americanus TaxID=51031 RepID=W2T0I0_NECAM|nr:hypothetical protein NECAME_12757 [Necator americanus]ETN74746.1 hypothetical protein NECAME_12757 [Necator americanus]